MNNTSSTLTTFSKAEWGYSIAAAALFFIYHIIWIIENKCCPKRVNLTYDLYTRTKWIKFLLKEHSKSILIVQTNRNLITGAAILATATMTVGFFITSLAIDQTTRDLRYHQYLVMSLLLFTGFYLFAITVVKLARSGYVVYNGREEYEGHDLEEQPPRASLERQRKEVKRKRRVAVNLLRSATIHFSIGLRVVYLSLLVASWVFSPLACFVITFIFVIVTYFQDHVIVSLKC